MAKDRISKFVLAGESYTKGMSDITFINADPSFVSNQLEIMVKDGLVSYSGQLRIKADAVTDNGTTEWGNMRLASGFPPSDGGICTCQYAAQKDGFAPAFGISSTGVLETYVRETNVANSIIIIGGFYRLKR